MAQAVLRIEVAPPVVEEEEEVVVEVVAVAEAVGLLPVPARVLEKYLDLELFPVE